MYHLYLTLSTLNPQNLFSILQAEWFLHQSNFIMPLPVPLRKHTKTIQWFSLFLERGKKQLQNLKMTLKGNLKGHWRGPTCISGFITPRALHLVPWKYPVCSCSCTGPKVFPLSGKSYCPSIFFAMQTPRYHSDLSLSSHYLKEVNYLSELPQVWIFHATFLYLKQGNLFSLVPL